MNFLNSIQSKLHGAINPNSVQYIKQQDLQVQLDPSGAAYVDHGSQAFSLNVDDENTTALAILDKTPSTQPLSLSGQSQFTICLKHKVQDATNPLIGQYYTNPQYDLSLSSTAIGTLDTFQVNVFNASDDPVSYSITGELTSADLSNADLSGTITNLYTPLSYTLRSGYGNFVFGLDGLSQQVSATMYKKYWVKSVTNLLGELVFGFSSTGSAGDYLNQPDISFGAGGKYMFDITDSTMTDLSLVFGTTVDNLSTVNDSVVTRTNDLVIVDISAGYDGSSLVYFEDTSTGMGYVSTGDGADTNIEPTVLWYNFDTSTVTGDNITNVATGSSLGDAVMTRSSIVTDVSKTGTGSLLCVRDGGNTQYVTLPSLTLPSEFTMCFWHKMTLDTGFASKIYLLYYLGVNTNDKYDSQYAIDIEVNNGSFDMIMNDSAGLNRYVYGTYPNDNEWHHIMFTKSSTESEFKLYLDNVERTPNKTVNMAVFSTSTYNSHYISGRSDINNITANYHMGGHTDDYRFYSKVLDSTERDIVYNYAPSQNESYIVDVSNGVFRLDSGDGNGFVEKPPIDFANNSGTTYIFDQSDDSNTDNTLVIGTTSDDPASIVSSGLTIVGTPGQPGAYTKYVSDGSTVYYFSYQTSNMGFSPP